MAGLGTVFPRNRTDFNPCVCQTADVVMRTCVACEPELMPSFPRYRNMKRKSSTAADDKTKPKADFGGAFGEPVSHAVVSGILPSSIYCSYSVFAMKN